MKFLKNIQKDLKLWFCKKTGVIPPNPVYFVWLSKNGSAKEILRAAKYGANVNAMFDGKISALMFALAAKREFQIIEAILKSGTDPNLQGECAETALMIAASKSASKEIIELLLDYGADVNLKNQDGQIAADFTENAEIKALLKNKP